MRKTLLSLGVMLVWTGSAFAGAGETVTIPADAYKAILERLDSLQQRVDTLEHHKAATAAPTRTQYDKLAKDINNIYDSLDEVETKSLRDRINFGGELRTRMDNYSYDNITTMDMSTGTIAYNDKDGHDDNNWTNRFRLNMDAEISKSLSFHGRLAIFKNWGDSDETTVAMVNDFNRVHRPGTSTVRLDRAYIDWVPENSPVPLGITIGRHPSTEGPPYELKEDRPRQSTYPSLLFDVEMDGIVATVGLERYIGLKNSGWRFAYGKGYHSDWDNTNSFSFFDDSEAGDTTMFATFLESEIPGLDNSLLVFSYANMMDLPYTFIGPTTATTGAANENLGDVDLYGVHLQVNNLMQTGLDVFLSWGYDRSDPNGKSVNGYGLLSADGHDRKSGSAIYAGMRYTIPFDQLNNPKVGFEYNHGSKYWMSMTSGTAELFNKLASRGDVYEVYYTQPVDKNLFFRAGYTHVDYDYTLSGWHIGHPDSTDAELDNYYLLMDCRF